MVQFGKNGFDSSDSSLQGVGKVISSFQISVTGCTTPSSGGVPNINYNGAATIDDGSCTPQVLGCMDATASNYNPLANTSDTCVFPGCTNSDFMEYDPSANVDDGSCLTNISYGCTDNETFSPGDGYYYPKYTNYYAYNNPCDEINGPGCVYGADGVLKSGENCCCIDTVLGCTDASAVNYDANANYNYTEASAYSCDYYYQGCNYPTACNYDPGAGGSDGSCGYCGDSTADNYNNVCTEGFGDQLNACKYCTIMSHDLPAEDRVNTYASNDQIVIQWTEAAGGWSSSDPAATWYQPEYNPNTMTVVPEQVTDPNAVNYGGYVEVGLSANPHALVTHYQIRYVEYQSGIDINTVAWVDLDASNVENWQESEYTGGQPSAWFGQLMPSGDFWYNGPEGPGAQTATLLYRIQGLNASTQYQIQMRSICPNSQSDNGGGQVSVLENTAASSTFGCIDLAACNYDATALYAWHDSCDYVSCIIPGCTDPTAFNYDPTANQDDNSCIACVYGCTDPTQFNYNPLATCDDGTCVPVVLGCTDPTVFNYDNTANTDDGSCCTIAGCNHPDAYNFDETIPLSCNDGSCNYIEVLGCIDPTAENYAGNTDYPNPNTAGTDAAGMDACFPGYQEELYVGTVGDITNWNNPASYVAFSEDGAVRIENQGGSAYNGSKLNFSQVPIEFSEFLKIGRSYRVEFEVRVSDSADGFNNSAAEAFVMAKSGATKLAETDPITYDGYHTPQLFSANGYYYQKHSLHFVADATSVRLETNVLNVGEYIWIKNISLKEQNVITNVISIDFPTGNGADGKYFHFNESVMSEMTGVVDDPGNNGWSGYEVNISQWRGGIEIWTGNVKVFGSEFANSEFNGWDGVTPPGHGRKSAIPTAGDWMVGDKIRWISASLI